MDLSDDTMVRIPGQDDPVKYGDLYKRLQADHTKKTTQAARARDQLARERQQLQTSHAQKEQQLQQLTTQLLAMKNQQNGGGTDYLTELEKQSVLDGKTAAQLMRAIQDQGFGSVAQAMEARDKMISQLGAQVQKMNAVVRKLASERTDTSFNSKISGWLKELDLDDKYSDLAKEIYLAYEGDDLDQEFPEILRTRMDQVRNLVRSVDKRRADEARGANFKFPGKGGQGSAARGVGLKGNESSSQVADRLWDALQAKDSQAT
jgi:DNA anti-recombination protein RmuC